MESGSGGTGVGAGWARYKDIYASLLQTTGDEVPHLFLEAIAQSYPEAKQKSRL
jgi:predicted component of type VI protein secretion system